MNCSVSASLRLLKLYIQYNKLSLQCIYYKTRYQIQKMRKIINTLPESSFSFDVPRWKERFMRPPAHVSTEGM